MTPPISKAANTTVQEVLQNAALIPQRCSWAPLQARLCALTDRKCPHGRGPQVYRIFLGAIVVKICSCNQCTTSFTEVMIRMPMWLTQFNLYVAGSPERILRLQRKVPWGSEESILKHCLHGNLEQVKHLLSHQRASLYDIDPSYGRTPLHVRGLQGMMCETNSSSMPYKPVIWISASFCSSKEQTLISKTTRACKLYYRYSH